MGFSRVRVGWFNGIVVSSEETTICFDPTSPRGGFGSVFISHAHGDHTAGFRSRSLIHATAETARIYEEKCGDVVKNLHSLRYGNTLKIHDIEVVTHNSGHILGSAQFEVRTSEGVVIYTGDINCLETLTTKPADRVGCDILIIESTYGSPPFIFPRRELVYMQMAEWVVNRVRCGSVPVLQVYSIGKAQEVIKLLNMFTEVPVVVHPAIARINDVYREAGVKLNFIDAASEGGEKMLGEGKCVYVLPTAAPLRFQEKISRAIATGWAVRFKPRGTFDAAFPLSSHADFKQLLNYVKEVKPRRVYTCFGFEEEFAVCLRRMGVYARPLMPLCQKDLEGFL